MGQILYQNPYKFGLVSGRDAHTGLAAMEKGNYFGKTSQQDIRGTSSQFRPSVELAVCTIYVYAVIVLAGVSQYEEHYFER